MSNFSIRNLDMNEVHEVKDITNNGKCTGCGGCCSNLIPVTRKEVETIKRYIKKHKIKPHIIAAPTAEVLIDATCPFLDTEKKTERCKIYKVRPYICRSFMCSNEGKFRSDKTNDLILMRRELDIVDMRKTFFG